jgi:hypothetical protein
VRIFRLFSLCAPPGRKPASLEGWQIPHATAFLAVGKSLMKSARVCRRLYRSWSSWGHPWAPWVPLECPSYSNDRASIAVREAPIKALSAKHYTATIGRVYLESQRGDA